MVHSIELSESFEGVLRQIAHASSKTEDEILRDVAEIVHANDAGRYGAAFHAPLRSLMETESGSIVRRRVEVMGGDACIRDTRIAVWTLVRLKQDGWTDERLLANYPVLTAPDLVVAWDFYAANTTQIEAERRAHE